MKTIRTLAGGLLALALLTAAVSLSQGPADEVIPPNPPVRWFKGNLHTHTLWSDGNDFPEMVADWYRRQGYNFLALSDHNILSEGQHWIDPEQATKRGAIGALDRYRARFGDDWVETRQAGGKTEVRLKPLGEFRSLVEERGKFIMIQGEELTDRFEKLPIHVNGTNVRDVIKPQGGSSVREVIKNNLLAVQQQSQRTGQPMLAHLNHPNFGYAVTAEDMAAVLEEKYFEVYNGHPGVHHHGDHQHAAVERLWDIANTIRLGQMGAVPLFGLANDDSHNYFGDRGASPGRGWVMVRGKHLTAESLIDAIKRGDFYASSGVTLADVRWLADSSVLEVDVQPVPGESYTIQFIGTLEGYDATREPVKDDKGNPLPVTYRYSPEVGQVLATVHGVKARYQLTGKELYVRAVISSDKPPVNPAVENQVKQAWTQPVGWEKRVTERPAAAAQ
jgi:hypothetical protein